MTLPDTFKFRPIEYQDINRGILELIREFRDFRVAGDHLTQWNSYLEALDSRHQHWVIVDVISQKTVASGTIWIEPKIIHNFGKVGHIEDIVVSAKYRNHGLGKYLVQQLVKLVNELGAYKVQLHSSQETTPFYEKIGFTVCDTGLSIYFSDT
jgi:glucosamine-phosphate N-acetyltransferase